MQVLKYCFSTDSSAKSVTFSNENSMDETKHVVTMKPQFDFLHESKNIPQLWTVWTTRILMQRPDPTLFVEVVSQWLKSRPMEQKKWVSNRILLYKVTVLH